MKIAILYICTGKYDRFWKDFYLTCEENFIKDSEKYYFVWTDTKEIFAEKDNDKISRIYQQNLGWPDNTLMRYDMFLTKKDELKSFDFILFFNANTIFLKEVTAQEFLCDTNQNYIAVQSPGYFTRNVEDFPYDRNERSKAYIKVGDGKYYFSGAINGGRGSNFLEAIKIIDENILEDKKNNIIALWHDESHWNNFLLGRQDTKVLSPAYLYPEGWSMPFNKIIMTRDRNKYGGTYALRDAKFGFFKDLKLQLSNIVKSFLKKR